MNFRKDVLFSGVHFEIGADVVSTFEAKEDKASFVHLMEKCQTGASRPGSGVREKRRFGLQLVCQTWWPQHAEGKVRRRGKTARHNMKISRMFPHVTVTRREPVSSVFKRILVEALPQFVVSFFRVAALCAQWPADRKFGMLIRHGVRDPTGWALDA